MVQSDNFTVLDAKLASLRGFNPLLLSRCDNSPYACSVRDLFRDAKILVLNGEDSPLSSYRNWNAYNHRLLVKYQDNKCLEISIDYEMSRIGAEDGHYCEKLKILSQRTGGINNLVFYGLHSGGKTFVLADNEHIPQAQPWGDAIKKEAMSILKNKPVVIDVHLPQKSCPAWLRFAQRCRSFLCHCGR